ncbi:hypothetical protein FVB43_21245 [Erwinia rhapontici]|uniref:hypothetical protein n=1 Tax=Erwinia rhapontici TaxID=55212 RepID=UPI001438482B|nr:hypothetical protein [Erwinia rhapontici]NKG32563.1 hypothetical protein [Erwinia rhapontici]
MNITVSDCVAFAALVVSMVSMRYAKQQNQHSRIAAHNDYRSYLSEQHAPYRKALKQIRDRHKDDISQLSRLAGETLTNVVHQFDRFDLKNHTPRYLRHLLHESSEMVFWAFRGQLAWQTAENLTWRLAAFIHIEDHLNALDSHSGDADFRAVSQQKYLADPNRLLESDLKNDIYFCHLVSELKSRINPEQNAELLLTMQREIAPFRAELERLQPQFQASATVLDDLIVEGVTEHFSLKESAELYQAMKKNRAILNTLGRLYFQPISENYASKYSNAVSLSIHTCAILQMIQGVSMWGVEFNKGKNNGAAD